MESVSSQRKLSQTQTKHRPRRPRSQQAAFGALPRSQQAAFGALPRSQQAAFGALPQSSTTTTTQPVLTTPSPSAPVSTPSLNQHAGPSASAATYYPSWFTNPTDFRIHSENAHYKRLVETSNQDVKWFLAEAGKLLSNPFGYWSGSIDMVPHKPPKPDVISDEASAKQAVVYSFHELVSDIFQYEPFRGQLRPEHLLATNRLVHKAVSARRLELARTKMLDNIKTASPAADYLVQATITWLETLESALDKHATALDREFTLQQQATVKVMTEQEAEEALVKGIATFTKQGVSDEIITLALDQALREQQVLTTSTLHRIENQTTWIFDQAAKQTNTMGISSNSTSSRSTENERAGANSTVPTAHAETNSTVAYNSTSTSTTSETSNASTQAHEKYQPLQEQLRTIEADEAAEELKLTTLMMHDMALKSKLQTRRLQQFHSGMEEADRVFAQHTQRLEQMKKELQRISQTLEYSSTESLTLPESTANSTNSTNSSQPSYSLRIEPMPFSIYNPFANPGPANTTTTTTTTPKSHAQPTSSYDPFANPHPESSSTTTTNSTGTTNSTASTDESGAQATEPISPWLLFMTQTFINVAVEIQRGIRAAVVYSFLASVAFFTQQSNDSADAKRELDETLQASLESAEACNELAKDCSLSPPDQSESNDDRESMGVALLLTGCYWVGRQLGSAFALGLGANVPESEDDDSEEEDEEAEDEKADERTRLASYIPIPRGWTQLMRAVT